MGRFLRSRSHQRLGFGRVEEHCVDIPDAGDDAAVLTRRIPDWTWFETPEFVNVLSRDCHGQWLVFRQVKYGVQICVGGDTLAPVGGYIEKGETPLEAAKRELLEETGYSSDNWIELGGNATVVDANRGAGKAHLFLALDAKPTPQSDAVVSDDLEEMHLQKMNSIELETALNDGQFKCLPWMSTVALSILYCIRNNIL